MVYQAKGREVQALGGIDLEVLEGTVFGFLGPNGAGKTTTMHILLGFLEQTEGEAFVFGENIRKSIARQRIGYLPEHPQTYPFLTGEELLKISGRLFGLRRKVVKERARNLLEAVGLADAGKRRIGTYSRGMLQRIGLAQALVNDPDLVILDEPTSGLDPVARMEIRALISWLRNQGKTVFFSSHELSEVEMVCDHVAILSNGKIAVQGSAPEMVRFGDSLEHYFLGVVQTGCRVGALAS
jgi:ABC-2 type transport system ATP-binding protein